MTKQTIENPWLVLKRFTRARVALGRAGNSMPTYHLLQFELAHAQACDAVHQVLQIDSLQEQLRKSGIEPVCAHSRAADRMQYLLRPDFGRRLDEPSRTLLEDHRVDSHPDMVFVLADGLSSVAAERHALPVLKTVRDNLHGWAIGPVVIAEQARVALGDEIGEILRAKLVVIMLGERPGLSSPDSLGIYITYGPHVGCTDAERNCISNVRPEGLSYAMAAEKLQFLLENALKLHKTGVTLKGGSGLYFPDRS